MDDLLLHVANGSLEGARPRVVDVVVILSDCALVSGYPSKVSLGQGSGLVLTAQGSIPGVGHDTTIDPSDVMWAWATSDDGSQKTFGTPAEELERVLGEALADGEDAGRLELALGALSHAKDELAAANRHYRLATSKLLRAGAGSGAIGDAWMRLAGVYIDMGDSEGTRLAMEQVVSWYESACGENHPRTVHARGVLASVTAR